MGRFTIAEVLERVDGTPVNDGWVLIDMNTETGSIRMTTAELLDLVDEAGAAKDRLYRVR